MLRLGIILEEVKVERNSQRGGDITLQCKCGSSGGFVCIRATLTKARVEGFNRFRRGRWENKQREKDTPNISGAIVVACKACVVAYF